MNIGFNLTSQQAVNAFTSSTEPSGNRTERPASSVALASVRASRTRLAIRARSAIPQTHRCLEAGLERREVVLLDTKRDHEALPPIQRQAATSLDVRP